MRQLFFIPAHGLAILVVSAISVPAARGADPTPQQLEFFEKKIRPVLVQNCKRCHSAKTRQRGGLMLDSRDFIVKGGDSGPAIVPGHPEKSRLLKAISYVDPDLQMPPRGKLDKKHIADITAWISMGAPWPKTDNVAKAINKKGIDLEARLKHWSFQPMKRPELPKVKDKSWPISPIDHFILRTLEKKGLKPNPAADRRTLLRRVYFDLIGLPPTPEEIDAFLKDDSPKAYEKVVERLLASPHYGERWGRHWLDLVRYAETRGHEFDFDMHEPWRYRDYVIRAFNNDVPYNQFVTEHIAGDLLAKPRLHPVEKYNESILATAFWFLGEGKHSPVDIRGDQADHLDNQIDVFGKTFLGLTLACAKCHDHKFDAITQRDYYSLVGYLQSSRYQQAFFENPKPLRDKVAKLQQLRQQMMQMAGLAAVGAAERKTAPVTSEKYRIFEDFRADSFKNWFVTGMAFGSRPSGENDIIFPALKTVPPHIAHSGLISNRLRGTLRSKTFIIDKKRIFYRVQGRGCRIRLIIDGFQMIRNPIYGGLEFGVNHGDDLRWHAQDVSMWTGHRAYVEIMDEGDGWIGVDRIVFGDDGPPQVAAATQRQLSVADVKQTAPQMEKLLQQYRQIETTLPVPHVAMAMADGSPVNEYLHIRGNHKNLGEEVPRRYLEAFVGNKPGPGTQAGSGRLELARKIVDPENPLTARVMVNRIWQHHFGEGIVKSVDNFGKLGEMPTHPELLDWLAREFIRRGWSIKDMHRLLVLSRTYQMSSQPQEAAKTIDPRNELLHRMPIKRLEGEIIRDALLAISGRLDKKMYGPGVMPHLTPFMAGRGRPGRSGPLDGDGRRSIYINVRRNFLTPLFLVFDYPVPFTTMGRRSTSNVPAQALTMMNNPFILQQTKRWADKVLAEKGQSAKQRIQKMYVEALGRPPSEREMRDMLAFLRGQAQIYGREDDPRVWHDLCHVIVNLKEFIYIS